MVTRGESIFAVVAAVAQVQARREGGGQKGSLPADPGFRMVRFRMQNSSVQITACGREDVFMISDRNSQHICGRYDLFSLIT